MSASNILVPTIVMGLLALILLVIGYYQGKGQHISGLKCSADLLIKVLPLVVFSFIIAGMIQVMLPKDLVAKWVGAESGIRGIFIGSFAGALVPSGPMVSFPVAAGLLKSGASISMYVVSINGT